MTVDEYPHPGRPPGKLVAGGIAAMLLLGMGAVITLNDRQPEEQVRFSARPPKPVPSTASEPPVSVGAPTTSDVSTSAPSASALTTVTAPNAVPPVEDSRAWKYVGFRYKTGSGPFPPGVQQIGSGVVAGPGEPVDYGYARIREGQQEMLWFVRIVAAPEGLREVIDALDLPAPPTGHELGTAGCRLNGVDDREIFAMAQFWKGERYAAEISFAWRLNQDTEKIETIPTDGVQCLNEGAGV